MAGTRSVRHVAGARDNPATFTGAMTTEPPMPSTTTTAANTAANILAMAAAVASAPRATRAAKVRGAPRISVASSFLGWLREQVTANGLGGQDLALAPLARAYCDEHYPARTGRETPWATIESQVRVAAKADKLPADVIVTSAAERAAAGLARVATIRVD